jgi:hypothetical protein
MDEKTRARAGEAPFAGQEDDDADRLNAADVDLRKKYSAKPAVMLPPSVDMCSSISLAPLCSACRHRLRTLQAELWLIGPMKWTMCKDIGAPSVNAQDSKFCASPAPGSAAGEGRRRNQLPR